jgi:hypothetical protein
MRFTYFMLCKCSKRQGLLSIFPKFLLLPVFRHGYEFLFVDAPFPQFGWLVSHQMVIYHFVTVERSYATYLAQEGGTTIQGEHDLLKALFAS